MDIITTKRRLDVIFTFVCNYYNVSEEEVRDKSRLRSLVMIRQRFYWLTRKHFYNEISLTLLGSFLRQDHATVVHGCKTVESLCESDKLYKRDLDELDYVFCRDVKKRISKVRVQELPKNEYQKIKKQKNDAERKANDMYYITKKYLYDFKNEINKDLVIEGFRKDRLNKLLDQKLKDLNNVKMRFN